MCRFVDVNIEDMNFMGLVIKEESNTEAQNPGQQCFPLFSYIKALNFPIVNLLRWILLYLSKSKAQDATIMDLRTINNKDARSQIYHLERLDIIFFFSLDIEGAEYEVLKTVPWDKVDIEVLLIELIHAGSHFEGSRDDVHQFLSSKSYVYLGTICMILQWKYQNNVEFFSCWWCFRERRFIENKI